MVKEIKTEKRTRKKERKITEELYFLFDGLFSFPIG